jgi:hypothetical protein
MEMPGKVKKTGFKQIATMLELNSQHIDQIRNYFVATSDEEKLSLQNSITPMFLKGFLNDLKRLFILEPDNEPKLISIAKSMGASKHIEALKEIQQQFYSQLAEIYLKGETNRDIDKMLEVNNQSFLNETAFQKELLTSFILNERKNLKSKFNEIDEQSEISDEEMESAFKSIERERLKAHFLELEQILKEGTIGAEFYRQIEREKAQKLAELSINNLDSSQSHAKINIFNWKKFAIAASVIGLIVTTTFIIFNQEKKQNNVVLNKPKTNKPKMDTNTLVKNQTANISTTTSPFPSDEKEMKILKEPSFGFAEKDEYLNVETNYLGSYLKLFKDSVKNETDATRRDLDNNIIDSLNNVVNKYWLRRNLLQIYILSKQEVKVFKIDSELYFKIGKTVYECKKSEDPLPLKKVTDKQTLETIDKILFNESN